jgi:hypothetical protein
VLIFEVIKRWFWSAKACWSKAEIPLRGAFAIFTNPIFEFSV